MSDDKDRKSRAERATSNVFARLPQKLMQEMKEAQQQKVRAATSNVLTKFNQRVIQEMKEV